MRKSCPAEDACHQVRTKSCSSLLPSASSLRCCPSSHDHFCPRRFPSSHRCLNGRACAAPDRSGIYPPLSGLAASLGHDRPATATATATRPHPATRPSDHVHGHPATATATALRPRTQPPGPGHGHPGTNRPPGHGRGHGRARKNNPSSCCIVSLSVCCLWLPPMSVGRGLCQFAAFVGFRVCSLRMER